MPAGHVSYLHHPSGTLLLGDAVINIWPSVSVEGGMASVLTYPLRPFGRGGAALSGAVGRALLRLLPRSPLAALVPTEVTHLVAAAGETLLGAGEGGEGTGEASVRKERVVSSGLSVGAGAGDERSKGTVAKGPQVKG